MLRRLPLPLFFLVHLVACSSCSSNDTPARSATADGGAPVGTTPGATTRPPGSGAPDDGLIPGDSVWRTKTEWYRAIDTAPVAETSGEMLAELPKWGQTGLFQIDFSFSVLDGTGASTVKFPDYAEGDNVPVPIPAKGYIEGDHPYDGCPSDDDCHILVLDPGGKKLYEVYQAHKDGGTWAGSVSLWQLDKAYPRSNRGAGCTSADAAGMAITPGLIGYRETKKGTIAHALRFIVPNAHVRGQKGSKTTHNVVYPASHGSTAGEAAKGIPYGARLRLKASFSDADPRVKTPGAKTIIKALKTYGMILADGGNLPLVAETAKVHADADPSATWDGTLSAHDLDFVAPTDFEVVSIPKDVPGGAPGWYTSRAEYEGQLTGPLGCDGIVQP